MTAFDPFRTFVSVFTDSRTHVIEGPSPETCVPKAVGRPALGSGTAARLAHRHAFGNPWLNGER